jgi:NADPH2:quinone reductase
MRAFGPPGVLEAVELPDPVPGEGELLIDVAYANITFVETQVRAGHPPHPRMAPALPVVPGNGVGGTTGGRRVISSTGGRGGYAERVAVPADGVFEVPGELSLADATALLADGRTALSVVLPAALQPGETVLVEAAGGGVGSLLVQLAVNAGAHVVALAGDERKRELARSLGAELVLDSRDPAWPRRLEGGVDVVFDGVGGLLGRTAFERLRAGGRFCPFGMASGAFAEVSDHDAALRRASVVRSGPLAPELARQLTRSALEEAVDGRLRPVIGQTFPLEQAAAAHAAIEERHVLGKTLLVTAATIVLQSNGGSADL